MGQARGQNLGEPCQISTKKCIDSSIGVLNHYDLIISKLFRGSGVDFEDCLALFRSKAREIDVKKLEDRYKETAGYDVSEHRVLKHWEHFKRLLAKEKLI